MTLTFRLLKDYLKSKSNHFQVRNKVPDTMIQPLMQGGLEINLVNFMIQAQDTLDLLKSQTKENHKPSSNNNNNHGNKPSASEDKTNTQSKKSIILTQNLARPVRIAAKLATKQNVVGLRRKLYTL